MCYAFQVAVVLGCITWSVCVQVQRSDDPDPLQTVVENQGQLISEMRAEMAAMKAKMNAMESEIAGHHRAVAFMVTLPSNQDLSNDPRVKFGAVSLNVGGGFHTATSSFVAPVSGLYLLILKVTSDYGPSGRYMTIGIMKGGHPIAETETNDNDDADRSSVQVIVQLKQGESVWVQKFGGEINVIWGNSLHSTFGGFLIQEGESF
ncbi:hypothetical protein BaRGS_00002200 [Batillaria attramentaria]|uniref:C1q domain-containing protein n=1 Tax=Batillaria attramentaria TaxID=370345 RepID=A0ABD0M4Y3_9CAEN